MTLGAVDYGLLGVVGGLAAFVAFINGVMASGVGRFYALSIGQCQHDPEGGMEECRAWFTTAVMIHTIVPIVLIIAGYPIGEWMVRHFLTIPPGRIEECVWVWRFTCVTTFVAMSSAPYQAMYGAKQEIAELTIYSFFTTTANACFLYYAVTHPGIWLSRFAAWGCFLSVTPSLIISIRALIKYPECRFRRAYMNCWTRVRKMLSYSGWLSIETIGDLLSAQGMNVLVNKYFGPKVNAAQAIGNNLSGQCTTLSASVLGAFWPAVMNAYGAKEYEKARMMAFRVCKLAPLFIMLFAIPLALEIHEVLHLWLKDPPPYAAGLCVLALVTLVGDRSTHGFAMVMYSRGDIAKYQLTVSSIYLLALPLAWLFFECGFSVYALGYAIILSRGACAFMRMVMSHKETGMSIRYWFSSVAFPLLGVAVSAICVGMVIRLFMAPSFVRICITSALCVGAIACISWKLVMSDEERQAVMGFINKYRQSRLNGNG